MNEQTLNKLALQSGFEVHHAGVATVNFWIGNKLDKFGELITEEHNQLLKMSLEALNLVKHDYIRMGGQGFDLIASSNVFDTIKSLEQHFGVEE